MSNGKLTILNEKFKQEGSDEEVEGLTVMIDGVMRRIFDKIKTDRDYASYDEVLRDVIFEGVNSIVKTEKN